MRTERQLSGAKGGHAIQEKRRGAKAGEMSAGQMHLQVNDRTVDWDENDSRPLRMCQGCRSQTRGMADGQLPDRAFANIPYCLTCAINVAFNIGGGHHMRIRRAEIPVLGEVS
jgi:hypothetical protein